MKKHICIITQHFYPESFRINDIATEWVKQGYRVSVLTGIPNYPQGRFYDGYGFRKKRTETWNGIRITRIPVIPRGHSFIGMVADCFSFMLSGLLWVSTHRIKADLIFSFETSPMTQVMVGCRAAKKNHIPHFLYAQDLWPENLEIVAGIRSPLVIKPIDRMVDYIYRNTDQIFVTSPSFVDAIANRKKRVPHSKVHYWPQYAEEFYRPLNRDEIRTNAKPDDAVHLIPDDDSLKIIFTGNIGVAQGLDILPKTAKLLQDGSGHKAKPVRFIIVGDGRYKEQFIKEIRKNGVDDMFTLIPRQNAEEIPKLLACCDAAFVSFMDNELFRKTIPAKLQSYMACGMPVIATAEGETARIVQEADCGVVCRTGDVNSLAASIKSFASLPSAHRAEKGRSAKAYSDQFFQRDALMEEMDRYIRTSMGTRPSDNPHAKERTSSKAVAVDLVS